MESCRIEFAVIISLGQISGELPYLYYSKPK